MRIVANHTCTKLNSKQNSPAFQAKLVANNETLRILEKGMQKKSGNKFIDSIFKLLNKASEVLPFRKPKKVEKESGCFSFNALAKLFEKETKNVEDVVELVATGDNKFDLFVCGLGKNARPLHLDDLRFNKVADKGVPGSSALTRILINFNMSYLKNDKIPIQRGQSSPRCIDDIIKGFLESKKELDKILNR